MDVLLDATGIDAALDRMAVEIAESLPEGCPIGIIGIRRRGDHLARRLMRKLDARGIAGIAFGTLDITMYRDDLAEIGPSAVVMTTEIPFDVDGRYLILVDDVIYSGRSVRSALAAIIDLGRPRAIRLAVLVDRGGRELPIQPDFVGKHVGDRAGQHVSVRLIEAKDDLDVVEVGA
ncbi:MAG: bifunctional pyr operon transcriptional regulator/uracil phosphoribosyltransferase PyrR [Phycisphaerales bacterium]|nr:bifunctional pyr operon transcriptional regulator/uracil phosphoribosyltransferase PyrR [Phycisphaerales bacterium]MCB9862459.1 bifunctional pyr operon transcriptional regulator/uracil phosphoribosyltransferase PyrR [Phycisphaerales bacterium]